MLELRDESKMSDKRVNYSHRPAQTKQQVGWCMLKHFGAWTSHEQTRNHKTHHDSNLKEATTFPFIVFFMLSHGASTQMSFCHRIPTDLHKPNPESPKLELPQILGAHNFSYEPLIEVRFKAKL
jgi:hypothetical protein